MWRGNHACTLNEYPRFTDTINHGLRVRLGTVDTAMHGLCLAFDEIVCSFKCKFNKRV